MRNRGIELFLAPNAPPLPADTPDAANASLVATKGSTALGGEKGISAGVRGVGASEEEDLEALLVAEGVPGCVLPAAMVAAHQEVARRAAARHR